MILGYDGVKGSERVSSEQNYLSGNTLQLVGVLLIILGLVLVFYIGGISGLLVAFFLVPIGILLFASGDSKGT
jgi:uncharacterized membrane protein